jgi:hypothetical protein
LQIYLRFGIQKESSKRWKILWVPGQQHEEGGLDLT